MLRMQMVDDIEADQNVLLKIRNGAWSFVTLEGGTLQIILFHVNKAICVPQVLHDRTQSVVALSQILT